MKYSWNCVLFCLLTLLTPLVLCARPNIPKNDRKKIVCSSCEECMESTSKTPRVTRLDTHNTSFCYTAISMVNDRIVVKRGAVRPDADKFEANFHPNCPDNDPDFGKVGQIFLCFCAKDNCNNAAFNDWGHVRKPFFDENPIFNDTNFKETNDIPPITELSKLDNVNFEYE